MYDYLVVCMKYGNILTNVFLPSIVLTLIEYVWEKNLLNAGKFKHTQINVGGSSLKRS